MYIPKPNRFDIHDIMFTPFCFPHHHTLYHSGDNTVSPLAASAYALNVYPSSAYFNEYITQAPVQLG